MDAVIICIGDELLTGDIEDRNSSWLARQLFERGVDLKKIMVIPDVTEIIASEIRNASADAIIITGGLGPTHDDVTREAVAKAAGVPLVRCEEAAKALEQRAQSRGRKLEPASYVMADIPQGSEWIPNPAGAAAGFIVDRHIFVFPGVPAELMAMFPLVSDRFHGKKMVVEWIITKRGESSIVGALNEAVRMFPSVQFGSYPSDVVKIKMKSRDADAVAKAKEWLAPRIV